MATIIIIILMMMMKIWTNSREYDGGWKKITWWKHDDKLCFFFTKKKSISQFFFFRKFFIWNDVLLLFLFLKLKKNETITRCTNFQNVQWIIFFLYNIREFVSTQTHTHTEWTEFEISIEMKWNETKPVSLMIVKWFVVKKILNFSFSKWN